MTEPEATEGMSGRRLLLNAAHLAVLSSFALAQPLFTALEAAFFIDFGSQPVDIVVLGLILTLGPPLVLILAEVVAARISPRLAVGLHLLFIGGLSAVLAGQLLLDAGTPPASVHALVMLAAGIVAAAVYRSLRVVRSFLTVLTPVPLLFLALFLFVSPTSKLVLPDGSDQVAERLDATAPVVFLLFDELPTTSLMDARDEIDASRYPAFARLAGDSTWFRNTATVHGFTQTAAPAILSGSYSREGSIPLASDHPHNLFTLLGSSYDLKVSEPYTDICPRGLCAEVASEPFGKRMRSLLANVTRLSVAQWLPERLARRAGPIRQVRDIDEQAQVGSLVRSMSPTRRPTLHFAHFFLPHHPFNYLPDGSSYPDDFDPQAGLLPDISWSKDKWLAAQQYQRHLAQLGYADRLLGRVLDRLEATGLYDRAVVVVTADHGTSFRPGLPRREPRRSNAEDTLLVPFLIKAPGQRRGRISDRQILTIDILPTVADLLDIRLPWKIAGRSAFRKSSDRPRVVALTEKWDRLSLPARWLERRRVASVRRKVALFGAGDGSRGLFGIGPRPRLHGRRVDASGLRKASGLTVALDPRDVTSRLGDVDPRGGELPARIAGYLRGPAADAGRPLAVVVNGRIRATTLSYRAYGEVLFTALVPSDSFERGRNEVQVLSISTRGLELIGG